MTHTGKLHFGTVKKHFFAPFKNLFNCEFNNNKKKKEIDFISENDKEKVRT